MHLPVSTSNSDTLIEELPISIPNVVIYLLFSALALANYFLYFLYFLYSLYSILYTLNQQMPMTMPMPKPTLFTINFYNQLPLFSRLSLPAIGRDMQILRKKNKYIWL